MSGDSQKLLELAERCEKAERPDRGLDAEIHFRIKNGIGVGCASDAPAFTGSLDAALTLVPEGHDVTITQANGPDRTDWYGRVKFRTPYGDGLLKKGNAMNGALALCAAALRARAAI